MMNTDRTSQKQETTGQVSSGSHISYWLDSVQPLTSPGHDIPSETDVVIIGGGIAGLSVAYNLVQAGIKIILVEDGNIGSGETGRTTAHLVSALDDRYEELQRVFGKEEAKLIAKSHADAIDFIDSVCSTENIACDFKRVDGYLFLHPSDKPESIDKELQACLESGIPVEKVSEVPGMLKPFGPAIKFPNQAKFHPMKYMEGLYKAITEKGGIILTNTHAEKIDQTGIVTKDGKEIKAAHIVVATNAPVNVKYSLPLKQYAFRTYVIAAKIKKESLPDVLWWDTGDFDADADIPPYHYVRLQSYNDTHDLLISGGEDHATGLADATGIPENERYTILEQWTREHFPIENIVYQWSGQVMEPMDSLAYIGKSPGDKNIYIITGDSGNGLTHATIAGKLLTDLIMQKENPLEAIYDPSRSKILKTGKVFLKEFGQGLFDYLKHKSDTKITEFSSLSVNAGKIIKLGDKQYGVYKDNSNAVHFVQAECTHMKCIIKWNSDEKTWDCPCHGSRFSYEGKVLNGPANTDLLYHKENEL